VQNARVSASNPYNFVPLYPTYFLFINWHTFPKRLKALQLREFDKISLGIAERLRVLLKKYALSTIFSNGILVIIALLRATQHIHDFSTQSTFEEPGKFTKNGDAVNKPTLVGADRPPVYFLLPQGLMADHHALASDWGIGTLQPSQRLADGDSSRYGSLPNPETQLDSYAVSCPVR
jgi:hypothetical protein